MVLYIYTLYKHDESRSGQVVIEDHMYNHNHIAINIGANERTILNGRNGTATWTTLTHTFNRMSRINSFELEHFIF